MQATNLAPAVISRLLQEVRGLVKSPPDGITYVENEENSVSEIHAILTGPGTFESVSYDWCDDVGRRPHPPSLTRLPTHTEGTPFYGGKFRMKLIMSHDYPSSPPRGFFITKIYHPNVAPNGDICVNTLKKDWTPETTLKHVLQVIRCLLIVPFPESSLNDEAGKLFMDSYEEFARRARIMTEVHALGDDEEGPEDGGRVYSSSSGKSVSRTSKGLDDGASAAHRGVGEDDDAAAAATSGDGSSSIKLESDVLGVSAKSSKALGDSTSGSSKQKATQKKSLKRL